jgi:hypothetical protein
VILKAVVLDNEANKLMLEQTAYKPLKKNINSVIMKSKKLKALASYSSSNDDDKCLFKKAINEPDNTYYYSVQRQYFVKIQRGKIDAEKLLFLRSLYQSN